MLIKVQEMRCKIYQIANPKNKAGIGVCRHGKRNPKRRAVVYPQDGHYRFVVLSYVHNTSNQIPSPLSKLFHTICDTDMQSLTIVIY